MCERASPSSSTGLLQRHDFGAAGLNSKGTYDCEFPPKLSVEQIKVPPRPPLSFFLVFRSSLSSKLLCWRL